MQNDAATIHCPIELCQAPNSQTDKFCQRCGTPLLKQYLWAVGEGIEAYKPGDLWGDRYLLKSHRIFLDTKPGLSPEKPESEISDQIKHYLRLVPYRLQVPQVYALGDGTAREILLLDQAPIYSDAVPLEGQLMPELTDVWKDATSLRQLNWLWQMAQLWQPLKSEGVASSLLQPKLLRVEGSLVRLLELQLDQESAPELTSLGQLWLNLLSGAKPAITGFFEQVCHSLIQGEVRSSGQLIALLDQGLAEVGLKQARTLRIATRTDKGPSRQRNEDACYPPSETTITKSPEAESALVIVCDGIGGHEGGNVASNLAIKTIQQQLQHLPLKDTHLDPTTLSSDLERVTCDANDQISQRNDKEHRYGRQRMGTTLVMALARAHEIYIGHVGDSRAYWITRTGCHQVTLDDDVASREVRLGYTLYRDALQQASSGSLVQALGMSPSASLHPTVQRFILDEDCVFLLCSDGLSDYDRVEQYWETEILPILDGKIDVATAGSRLVELANTQNGHDNVTVGLIHCQVSSSEPESTLLPSQNLQITVPPDSAYLAETDATVEDTNRRDFNTVLQLDGSINFPAPTSPSTLQTKVLPSQRAPRRFFLPIFLGIILLLSLGGGLLAYFFRQKVSGTVNHLIGISRGPSITPKPPTSSPPTTPPVPKAAPVAPLGEGTLIKLKSPIHLNHTELQHNQRGNASLGYPEPYTRRVLVPANSVLLVVRNGTLLTLRICSTPGTEDSKAAKSTQKVKQGDSGSIRAEQLLHEAEFSVTTFQAGKCHNSNAPPARL